MKEMIEDLLKVYLSSLDSYNSKIYQTINAQYTIIDKSMLTVYLFIKIVEDRNEKNQEITNVLSNYLLKQIIYGETGNLAFKIRDKSKISFYHEILDKLILEKFEYKNRMMQKLKYNYKNLPSNPYTELLIFLENIAEFAILQKIALRGNPEAIHTCQEIKDNIINQLDQIKENDDFYQEKKIITTLIAENKFNESQYGNLMKVALDLKEVYRYSNIPTQLPENVLFHQYTVAIFCLLLAEYSKKELKEKIDIYTILLKALFHDFGEYKGTEIITHLKNYNETTKKMFAEIEEEDQKDLEAKIGLNLYTIILQYEEGAEGFIASMTDKMLGITKLWVEVECYHNYTFIRLIHSIYQDRFKRFLKIETIDQLTNKSFYIDLLREYYIYIKEYLVEKNLAYFFLYYTEEELKEFREEIALLKKHPEAFLK